MKWQNAFGWGAVVVGLAFTGTAQARTHLCADSLTGLDRLMSVEHDPLNAELVYRSLDAPEKAYDYVNGNDKHEVMEVARITHATDPVLDRLLGEVYELGAEVRLLKGRVIDAEERFVRWSNESPYFWVNLERKSPSYLRRIIAFDPTQPRALASLAHEIQHLRIWTNAYHLALAHGEGEEQACQSAWRDVTTLEATLEGERRAVAAEIEMELAEPSNPFNRPYAKPTPVQFWEAGIVARLTYPEYQVVRLALKNQPAQVDAYVLAWIERAEEMRARALAHLEVGDARRGFWEDTPLLSLMLGPFGHVRLASDKTLGKLEAAVAHLRP